MTRWQLIDCMQLALIALVIGCFWWGWRICAKENQIITDKTTSVSDRIDAIWRRRDGQLLMSLLPFALFSLMITPGSLFNRMLGFDY